MSTPQEAQWVLRAQYGDRDALERVLRGIYPALLRYLQGLVGTSDADDVLQDVLLVVGRRLGQLEEPALLRPWAFRIASRAGLKHLKRDRRWQRDDAVDELAAPEPPAPNELVEALSTLDGISPASRAVLVLHFREELSLPEIAAILELPLGTVKSRLAYGLNALRMQVKQRGRL